VSLRKHFAGRIEIGPKHFDELKPEPGPTYNSGPDWIFAESAIFIFTKRVCSSTRHLSRSHSSITIKIYASI